MPQPAAEPAPLVELQTERRLFCLPVWNAPKVIWIRHGNSSTHNILELLRVHQPAILAFNTLAEAGDRVRITEVEPLGLRLHGRQDGDDGQRAVVLRLAGQDAGRRLRDRLDVGHRGRVGVLDV